MAPVRRPLRILLGTEKKIEKPSPSPRQDVRRSLRANGKKPDDSIDTEPSTSKQGDNWRTRMKKNNPKKYEERKAQDCLYSKLRNASLNDDEKERRRVLTRERVKRFRQKKKEKEEGEKGKSKQTKSKKGKKQEEEKITEQRRKWAGEKRKQRELWSTSKREEVNLRARMKRSHDKEELQQQRKEKIQREKKQMMLKIAAKQEEERRKKVEEDEKALEQQEQQLALDKSCTPVDDTPRSKEARRKSLSRARSTISISPKIFAATIEDLIEYATPRKKKALEHCGLRASGSKEHNSLNTKLAENVAASLKDNKQKRDKCSRTSRRSVASTLFKVKLPKKQVKTCAQFSTTPKYLKALSKSDLEEDKYRNPFAIKQDVKKSVREFYETNSLQLPNKKDISKKTFQKTSVLQMPINEIYNKFKSANPDVKIGISSFKMLRPQHVKLMSTRKMAACLCEYCTNLELKLSVLNKINKAEPIKNMYELNKLTLCKRPTDVKYDAPKCYRRECSECGVQLLKNHLQPLEAMLEKTLEWTRWEMVQSSTGDKRMQLVTKKGTVGELVEEILKEAHPHARHLHNWWWQHHQYMKLTKDPPPESVVAVLDFAENYSCLSQNEVQAAHWWHNQATVHPIVANYRCPCHDRVITHSMVYITDDKKHDHHAVQAFFMHSLENLTVNHGINIGKMYRFSDGCASQYKSKGPFLDVANCHIPTEHHFFGSRHGKGPSDGESAVVKQHATVAVKNGTAVIPTAEALFQYLKEAVTKGEQECVPFRREIFYITKDKIQRERPVPKKAVKGTRLLHCLKSSGIDSPTISWKFLSCFCSACLSTGLCQNVDHTGSWKSVKLEIQGGKTMTDLDVHPRPGFEEETSTQASDDETEQIDEETMTAQDAHQGPTFQDFVTVQLAVEGKKKASDQFFVAQVVTVEGNNLRLQYMKQQGRLYTWPAGEPQYFLHPLSDIVRTLPSPEPVMMGSRVFFKFP
ncbi:uncharacterized protein LOC135157146 isoform X2 [Lytechinus pictus]